MTLGEEKHKEEEKKHLNTWGEPANGNFSGNLGEHWKTVENIGEHL